MIPFLIGDLYHSYTKEHATVASNWCAGFIVVLGLLQVLALPCIFLKTSLDLVTGLYCLILVAGCVYSVILNHKNYRFDFKKLVIYVYKYPWQIAVMVLVVAFQMYKYIAYKHVDADDSFFVGLAVTAVDTNTLFEYSPYTGELYEVLMTRYVFSPFFIFSAILSNVFGIHAAVLYHTVLPPIYLLLAYTVVGLLGCELYDKNIRKVATLVAVTGIITMYFSTSIYTQSSFMLLRIWQGKAFLAAVLLPFVFYLGYKLFTDRWTDESWIVVMFTMLACCLASSMGIMLGAIAFGIIGIICAINKRDIKILIKSGICCIPNVVLAIAYLLCG